MGMVLAHQAANNDLRRQLVQASTAHFANRITHTHPEYPFITKPLSNVEAFRRAASKGVRPQAIENNA